jgi:hypothetical protein
MTLSQFIVMDHRFAHDAPEWDNGKLHLRQCIELDSERKPFTPRAFPYTEDCLFFLHHIEPYARDSKGEYCAAPVGLHVFIGDRAVTQFPFPVCAREPTLSSMFTPFYTDFKSQRLHVMFECTGKIDPGTTVGVIVGGNMCEPEPPEDREWLDRQTASLRKELAPFTKAR